MGEKWCVCADGEETIEDCKRLNKDTGQTNAMCELFWILIKQNNCKQISGKVIGGIRIVDDIKELLLHFPKCGIHVIIM